MAEESINLPVISEVSKPEAAKLRRNNSGKPNIPNSKQNVIQRRASIGPSQNGGNSRNTVENPVTPESGKNVLQRRASIGPSHNVGNSRKNLVENPVSPTTGENVLPRYLRASTGSCHDFCKSGREHAFEEKARRPIRKRITKSLSGIQDAIVSVVTPESRKKMVVKPKLPVLSGAELPETAEIIKREVSSSSKRIGIFKKHTSSSDNKISEKAKKKTDLSTKLTSSFKPKAVTPKPLPSSNASANLHGKRNSDIKNSKKETSKATVTKVLASSSNLSNPMPSVNSFASSSTRKYWKSNSDIKNNKTETSEAAVKIVLPSLSDSYTPIPSVNSNASSNTRKYRNTSRKYSGLKISPLKDENRTRRPETKQSNGNRLQEKTLHVIKTDNETETKESAQNGATQMPPSPVLQSDNNKLQEKIVHVIKSDNEKETTEFAQDGDVQVPPTSSSHPNPPSMSSHKVEDLEESEYTAGDTDGSISENDATINMDITGNSDRYYKRIPRKGKVVPSEDQEGISTKLKFKRGKVIDLQGENNGARRLRFRRGRVLGENQDSKNNVSRRNFKKRGVTDDTNGSNKDAEKVVLRHQDGQEKKDAQGLFNNVIEETASKLVESRKSKVKALVGAFETVISLQETPTEN